MKDPAAESRRRRTNKIADEGAPEGDASAGVDGAQPSAASAEGKPAEGRRGKKDKAAKAAAASAPPAEPASEISPESGAQTEPTAEGADKDIEEVAAAPSGDKEHWDLCLLVDASTSVEEDAEKVLTPSCWARATLESSSDGARHFTPANPSPSAVVLTMRRITQFLP